MDRQVERWERARRSADEARDDAMKARAAVTVAEERLDVALARLDVAIRELATAGQALAERTRINNSFGGPAQPPRDASMPRRSQVASPPSASWGRGDQQHLPNAKETPS
jgi:hypothetical protein